MRAKRLLSLLMALTMLFTLTAPVFTFAAGDEEGGDPAIVDVTGGSDAADPEQTRETQYSVTVNKTGKGTVDVDPASGTSGTPVTLTVTPDAGYSLSELRVNDDELDITVNTNQYIFTMPEGDVIVTVVFNPMFFNIEIAEGIEHGSVAAPESIAVVDSTVSLTVTPDPDYALDTLTYAWSGSDDPVAIANSQFTMPAGDVIIHATFASTLATVRFFDGIGDETPDVVSVSKGQLVPEDDIPVFPAPNSDYEFGGWLLNNEGEPIDLGTYVINADTDFYAKWNEIPSPACTHVSLVHVDEVPATCIEAGVAEHWHCDDCGKDFIDDAGITEAGNVSIPALGHNMTAHAAVAPTCTEAGNSAFWSCDRCNKFFSDEDGEHEIEADSWAIPALISIPEAGTENNSDSHLVAVIQSGAFTDEAVEIQGVAATVTFNAAAAQALASAGDLTLDVSVQDGANGTRIIDITLNDSNDQNVFTGSEGAKAAIAVPYTVAEGRTPVVYQIIGDERNLIPGATYNAVANTVTFEVSHFSRYEIGQLGNAVARIGQQEYMSMSAAIAAVPLDGTETTITLLGTVFESISVPNGANLVLNLNGQHIYTPDAVAISNLGTLKIIGSGSFSCTNATAIQNEGIMSVAVGRIDVDANCSVFNKGTLTISDGWLYTHTQAENCAIENDGSHGGTVTITGGTVEGYTAIRLASANASALDLAISGGSIVAHGGADIVIGEVLNTDISITGGTFYPDDPTPYLDSGAFVAVKNGSSYTVIEIDPSSSCTHAHIQRDSASDRFEDNPDDNKYHTRYRAYVCTDCGAIVSEIPEQEAHVWRETGEEFVCQKCDHVNTCEHEYAVTERESWADESQNSYVPVETAEGAFHDTTGTMIVSRRCDDCGLSWTEERPEQTRREHHNYYDGYCEQCRHEHPLRLDQLALDCAEEITLAVGQSMRVAAVFTPTDSVRWETIHLHVESYDNGVNTQDILDVSRDSDMHFTLSAMGAGEVYISLESFDGHTTSPCHVTVIPRSDENKCGNDLYWQYDNGTLTITGNGSMDMYSRSAPAPWADYSDEITAVVLPENITSIGSYAFYRCSNLATIELPEGLVSIGSDAFRGCGSLTSLLLPSTLTTIGREAFMDTGLTTIMISAAVTSIGDSAFRNCQDLASITVDQANTYFTVADGILFDADMTTLMLCPVGRLGASCIVPDTVTAIAPYAFQNNTNLTSVTLPNGLLSIGDGAFLDCSALGSVQLPYGLKTIGMNAFENCSSLTGHIVLPDSIASIGRYAFANCSFTEITFQGNIGLLDYFVFENNVDLKKVTICGDIWADPNRQWWTAPFDGCTSLETIIVEEGVTRIAEEMFAYIPSNVSITLPSTLKTIDMYAFWCCTGLTSIVIPEGVTIIDVSVFQGCTGLTSVTIPEGVTTLERDVFDGCTNLTSINLPSTLTSIGENCFYNSGLTSVSIPEGVTTIGSGAFSRCGDLVSIDLPISLQQTGTDAFWECYSLAQINYAGTRTDKKAISFDTGSLSVLRNAVWQYSYTGYDDVNVTENTDAVNVEVIDDNAEQTNAILPADVFVNETGEEKGVTIDAATAQVTFDAEATGAIVTNAGESTDLTLNLTVTENTEENTKTLDISLQSGETNVFADGTAGTATITVPYAGADANTVVNLVTVDGNGDTVKTPVPVVSYEEGVSVTFTVPHFSQYEVSGGSTSATNTCGDNLTWSFDYTNGTLTITGTGAMYDFASSEQPWESIQSDITVVYLPSGLTSIGDSAFSGCTAITDVYYDGTYQVKHDPMATHTGSVVYLDQDQGVFLEFNSLSIASGNDQLTADTVTWHCRQTCGDSLTWFFDESSGVLTISGSGEMYDYEIINRYGEIYPPWHMSRAGIRTVTIPEGLTGIGNYAFAGCGNLLSAPIPSTVTKIGDWAFEDCYQMGSADLPDGLVSIGEFAFSGCYGLTEIVIPDTVTSIGGYAFSCCSSLTSVTLGNGVTVIDYDTFHSCDNLTSVTIPNSVISISYGAFSACSSLTDVFYDGEYRVIHDRTATHNGSVRYVDQDRGIFWDFPTLSIASGNNQLTASSVTWHCRQTCGSSLTWLFDESLGVLTISGTGDMYDYEAIGRDGEIYPPWYLFNWKIGTVIMPEGLTRIGNYAFAGCGNPLSAPIPSTVTAIGDWAFSGCGQMGSADLPEGLISIGEYSFYGCSGLTEIIIPDTVTSIGAYAFSSCSSLTSVTLSDTLTSIGEFAFNGCSGLAEIIIPDTVTSIEWHAFSGCGSLTSATLGNGVTVIDYCTFSGCYNLTSVTIPNSVINIKDEAFYYCRSLQDVYYLGTEGEAAALKAQVADGNEYLLNAQWHCLGAAGGWTIVDVSDFDPAFWAWLLEQYDGDAPRYAKEENGSQYINLDADWMWISGQEARLSSIRGVNKFVNLEILVFEGFEDYEEGADCRLTEIDLAGMTKLRELNLNGNELTAAALNACGWNKTTIEKLEVGHMGIDDLSFLSGFTALKDLNVSDSGLTALDVSAFTTLERLDCQFNGDLADLTINPGLKDLEMGGTQLNKDNVNFNGAHLTVIKVDGMYFDLATLQSFTDLETLDVDGYDWGTFDFSPWSSLKDVRCDNSNLTSLTLGTLNDLTRIRANDNKLTSLDLSKLNGDVFNELYIGGNSIPALTLPEGTALQDMDWDGNPLGQRIEWQTLTEVGEGTWSFNVTSLSNAVAVVDPAKVTVTIDENVMEYDSTTGIVTFNAAVESFTYQYDIGDTGEKTYTMPVTVLFNGELDFEHAGTRYHIFRYGYEGYAGWQILDDWTDEYLPVSIEDAEQLLADDNWIHLYLYAIPTGEDVFYTDALDQVVALEIYCGGTIAFNFQNEPIHGFTDVFINHPDANVTISMPTPAGETSLFGAVVFNGNVTFNGDLNYLVLAGKKDIPNMDAVVMVEGNVQELVWYDDSAVAFTSNGNRDPYMGDLYVSGAIVSGIERGQRVLNISEYIQNVAADYIIGTFSKPEGEPALVIEDGELKLSVELNEISGNQLQVFYRLEADGQTWTYGAAPLGSDYYRIMGTLDNFDVSKIVPGLNVAVAFKTTPEGGVELSGTFKGVDVYGGTVHLTGDEGDSIGELYVNEDPDQTASVTIDCLVNELQIEGINRHTAINTGTSGSVDGGYWHFYAPGWDGSTSTRLFDAIGSGQPIMTNGTFQRMSTDEGGEYGAIPTGINDFSPETGLPEGFIAGIEIRNAYVWLEDSERALVWNAVPGCQVVTQFDSEAYTYALIDGAYQQMTWANLFGADVVFYLETPTDIPDACYRVVRLFGGEATLLDDEADADDGRIRVQTNLLAKFVVVNTNAVVELDFEHPEERYHGFVYGMSGYRGWQVFDEQTHDYVPVSAGDAERLLINDNWYYLSFFAIPSAEELFYTEHLSGLSSVEFVCGGSMTFDAVADTLNLYSITVNHPEANITVNYAAEDRPYLHVYVYSGSLAFTGNINELTLNGNGRDSNAASVVRIDGDVDRLTWAGPTSEVDSYGNGAPYLGDLYVTGTIEEGAELGKRDVAIENIGTISVNLQVSAFAKTADDEELVIEDGVLKLETNALPGELTSADVSLRYQAEDGGEAWTLFVGLLDGGDMSSVSLPSDFDSSRIISGENVDVIIFDSPADGTPIVLAGSYRFVDIYGGAVQLTGSMPDVYVCNFWLDQYAVHPRIHLTIDGYVEYLSLDGVNWGTDVVTGADGRVDGGCWHFYFNGRGDFMPSRSFGAIDPNQQVMTNGSFLLMSVDGNGEYGAIGTRIDDLTAAAGISNENSFAAMEIINANVELNSAEQALVEAAIPDGIIVTEFEVQVNAYTVNSNGDLVDVSSISDLGEAEATFYFEMPDELGSYQVVRLHEENGELVAAPLGEPVHTMDADMVEVTSNLFSKYVLVKVEVEPGALFAVIDEDTVTATMDPEIFSAETPAAVVVVVDANASPNDPTSICFNAEASALIAANAEDLGTGYDVILTVEKIKEDAEIGSVTYDVTMTVNGEPVFSEASAGSKAAVTVPYAGADANTVVNLVTVDENSNTVKTPVPVVSYEEGVSVTFMVPHFSRYEVSEVVAKVVSGVTEMNYTSLEEAIAAAASGATITLLADIALTATQEITKDLTIDLNGHDITATDARALWIKNGDVTITGEGTISANGEGLDASSSVIRVGDSAANANKAKLTVGENVTVSSGKSYGITVFGKNANGIELVVDGTVSVTGTASAVSGNGSAGLSATVMTINGTVTATQDYAIYHPGTGTLTVNGTVSGLGGIEVKGGSITINETATVTATATEQTHSAYNNGASTSGYAIAAVSNPNYAGEPTVEIKGATINGKAIILADFEAENAGVVTATSNTIATDPGYGWVATGTPGVYQLTKELGYAFPKGVSASFNDSIKLNFYIDYKEDGAVAAMPAGVKAVATYMYGTTEKTVEFELDDVEYVETPGDATKTGYKLSVSLVAKQVEDVVTIKLYDANDNPFPFKNAGGSSDFTESGINFSLLQYLNLMLKDDEWKELGQAAKDYFYAAAQNFDYDVPSGTYPISSNINAVTVDTLKDYKPVLQGSVTGVTPGNITAMFETDNSFRFYLTFAAGYSPDDGFTGYTYTVDGSPATLKQRPTDGAYYLTFTKVYSNKLHLPHTITVSDGTDTITVNASVLSYAWVVLANNGEESTLVKAVYLYNRKALDKFPVNE